MFAVMRIRAAALSDDIGVAGELQLDLVGRACGALHQSRDAGDRIHAAFEYCAGFKQALAARENGITKLVAEQGVERVVDIGLRCCGASLPASGLL